MGRPSRVEAILFAAPEAAAERAEYLDRARGSEAARRRAERPRDGHPKAADFPARPAVDGHESDSHDAADKSRVPFQASRAREP
jgi:hypothetical protein